MDVALVNAVRCRPHKNATPTMSQLRACRPFLLRAIWALRPAAVLCLGGSAAKAVLDSGGAAVTPLRGRVVKLAFAAVADVEAFQVPVRFTYHPSAVLRGATHLKQRIIDDLKRCRGSKTLELDILTDGLPVDKVVAVDTEYNQGNILTIAVAGLSQARAWDVGDGLQGAS